MKVSKEKAAEYQRTWRARHPEKIRAQGRKQYAQNPERYRAASKACAQRARAFVVEQKSKPCMDCRGCFHFSAMDFDHVRGEKSFALGDVGSRTMLSLVEEIAKCDLVCANCHRVRTYKRLHGKVEL